MNSRRKFVKQTALVGAGLSILPSLSFASNIGVSNQKLKIAFIGVGLRGTNHLNNALLRSDIEVTAICDIDSNRIDIALKIIADSGAAKPKVFGKSDYDYRNLFIYEREVKNKKEFNL